MGRRRRRGGGGGCGVLWGCVGGGTCQEEEERKRGTTEDGSLRLVSNGTIFSGGEKEKKMHTSLVCFFVYRARALIARHGEGRTGVCFLFSLPFYWSLKSYQLPSTLPLSLSPSSPPHPRAHSPFPPSQALCPLHPPCGTSKRFWVVRGGMAGDLQRALTHAHASHPTRSHTHPPSLWLCGLSSSEPSLALRPSPPPPPINPTPPQRRLPHPFGQSVLHYSLSIPSNSKNPHKTPFGKTHTHTHTHNERYQPANNNNNEKPPPPPHKTNRKMECNRN